MSEHAKYERMNIAQLQEELRRIKDLLADILEEREFLLCKTSIHVPGHKVRSYDAEINAIKNTIIYIEELINKKTTF